MNWKHAWKLDPSKQIKRSPIPEYAKGRSSGWSDLIEYQALAMKLLAQTDGTEEVFEYIDKAKLTAIATTDPEMIKKDWTVWGLQSVVGGLMWYLEHEDRTSIDVKYEGMYPSEFS